MNASGLALYQHIFWLKGQKFPFYSKVLIYVIFSARWRSVGFYMCKSIPRAVILSVVVAARFFATARPGAGAGPAGAAPAAGPRGEAEQVDAKDAASVPFAQGGHMIGTQSCSFQYWGGVMDS